MAVALYHKTGCVMRGGKQFTQQGRGPLVLVRDESGSMSGDPHSRVGGQNRTVPLSRR